jgi:hypothetical protein
MKRTRAAKLVVLAIGFCGILLAQQYPQQYPPYQGSSVYADGQYPQDPGYAGDPYGADPYYADPYYDDGLQYDGVYAPAPPQVPGYGYVRPPMPGPDYVWIDGYWNFLGGRYVWVSGYWTLPPYIGGYWVRPRWAGGRFFAGHWGGRGIDPRGYRVEHGFAGNGFRHDYQVQHPFGTGGQPFRSEFRGNQFRQGGASREPRGQANRGGGQGRGNHGGRR